ncbi:LD-carboxypeptidase, partial [Bacillus toyonensis]
MIYPNALQQGDTVMIIAPSGKKKIENVLKVFLVLDVFG